MDTKPAYDPIDEKYWDKDDLRAEMGQKGFPADDRRESRIKLLRLPIGRHSNRAGDWSSAAEPHTDPGPELSWRVDC